jgi:hypothetical protein
MKKIVLFSVFFLAVFSGKTQFAVDAGINSQRIRDGYGNSGFNFLGTRAAFTIFGKKAFVKLGYKQSFSGSDELQCYTIDSISVFGYEKQTNYNIPYRYSESGFIFGFGFNFTPTKSKSRPYLLTELAKLLVKYKFTDIGSTRYYTDNFSGQRRQINDVHEFDVMQFRLGAGIQIEVTNRLTVFNEASINYYFNPSRYARNLSVDMGVRYYL